jgi:hypothetical protein
MMNAELRLTHFGLLFIIHHSAFIISRFEAFHVLIHPRLPDSEYDCVLGGGVCGAAVGAAMGIGRSAGSSQDPLRADAD